MREELKISMTAHQKEIGDHIDGKVIVDIEYYDNTEDRECRIIFTFEDGTSLDVEEYESV